MLLAIEILQGYGLTSIYNLVMFSAVSLIFLYVILCFLLKGRLIFSGKGNLPALLMTLVFCADGLLELPFFSDHRVYGYVMFCAAQLAVTACVGWNRRVLLLEVLAVFAGIGLLVLAGRNTVENAAGLIDVLWVSINIVYSWMHCRKENDRELLKTGKLFAMGMTLWGCCDMLILVRTLLASGTIPYQIVFYLVWLFYIPGLLFVAYSYLYRIRACHPLSQGRVP